TTARLLYRFGTGRELDMGRGAVTPAPACPVLSRPRQGPPPGPTPAAATASAQAARQGSAPSRRAALGHRGPTISAHAAPLSRPRDRAPDAVVRAALCQIGRAHV